MGKNLEEVANFSNKMCLLLISLTWTLTLFPYCFGFGKWRRQVLINSLNLFVIHFTHQYMTIWHQSKQFCDPNICVSLSFMIQHLSLFFQPTLVTTIKPNEYQLLYGLIRTVQQKILTFEYYPTHEAKLCITFVCNMSLLCHQNCIKRTKTKSNMYSNIWVDLPSNLKP